MREIIFRGKDNGVLRGMWQYGSLDISHPDDPRIVRTDRYNNKMGIHVLVETLGQFTGLIDMNGRRIFEGDIVDVEYDIQYVGVSAERIGLFVVVFEDGCFMKKKEDGGLFHFIPSDKCKVVGNIHDNPELMEEWKNGSKEIKN